MTPTSHLLGRRATFVLLAVASWSAGAAAAALPEREAPSPPPRWQPPPQGAVEMFRQMPRAFEVGGGGAGGEATAAAAPDAGSGQEGRGVDFIVHLAPLASWDAPEGPTAHFLPEGTVRFFRPGAWRPEVEGKAGEAVELPPGEWWLTAEAPGFASTAANLIPVAARQETGGSFVAAVAPACRVELAPRRDWQSVERVDVVSLTEGAVYPVPPRERAELWVPVGDLLAYTLVGDRLDAVGEVHTCRAGETVTLARPEPPARDRQSLLATLRLPEGFDLDERERLLALLEDPVAASGRPSVLPSATIWQKGAASFFFLDLPADRALELAARHPLLRSEHRPVEPLGGSVREVPLGDLRPRRDYEVVVDYRPARPHREERLELRGCGREMDSSGDEILVYRCREPVAEAALRPGSNTYVFPDLDDGQYLLMAVVDDEWVAGLGRDMAPFLDPADDLPPPVESHPLVEVEVYGNLLRGGEAVPGTVRLAPWSEDAGIPARTAATDDDLLYHLFYFARTLTPEQAQHLPEPLRDEDPDDLPGLYCCFSLTACSDAGLCRPFNIHSTFTGGGRFDLELPGDEVVDFTVLDAASGEPIPGARLLLMPGAAFHFDHGEVIWAEALGMEPDSLRLGADGRARWAPPGPGSYPTNIMANGYESEFRRVEVAAGEDLALEVRLTPEPDAVGAWLGFADGRPVAGAALLPFDGDGRFRHDCRTGTDAEGRVALVAGCQEATFVVVHPGAALVTVEGSELAGRAGIEVRERPAFPLRLRVTDEDGRELSGVAIQLRLGDLTITPNDLLAGATNSLPWQRTDAAGRIVLLGADPAAPGLIEVAPWGEWEGEWTAVSSADLAVGRPLEIVASPAASDAR